MNKDILEKEIEELWEYIESIKEKYSSNNNKEEKEKLPHYSEIFNQNKIW